jgi:hypothetical protein
MVIVQARFPTLVELAKEQAEQIKILSIMTEEAMDALLSRLTDDDLEE